MFKTRILTLLSLAAAFASVANAQLAATLKLNKKEYLAGEPVIAVLTVTNHAGQDLTFYGDGRTQWLDFIVKDRHGEDVSNRGKGNFGKMTIKAGQSLSRQVDISQLVMISEPGNYSAVAVVHMPGNTGEGSSTNRVVFNQSPGAIYWSQKVGIPGAKGNTREFRIINFNGDSSAQIYVQVIDGRTGQNVRTFALGDVLSLRKPLVTVDRQQRLHVLYLATPTMWVHCQIDTDGKMDKPEVHQRGSSGEPKLIVFNDGTVRVANSIPVDQKADAEAKAKIRKASDRPPGTY